jgi:hypothetical protein
LLRELVVCVSLHMKNIFSLGYACHIVGFRITYHRHSLTNGMVRTLWIMVVTMMVVKLCFTNVVVADDNNKLLPLPTGIPSPTKKYITMASYVCVSTFQVVLPMTTILQKGLESRMKRFCVLVMGHVWYAPLLFDLSLHSHITSTERLDDDDKQ